MSEYDLKYYILTSVVIAAGSFNVLISTLDILASIPGNNTIATIKTFYETFQWSSLHHPTVVRNIFLLFINLASLTRTLVIIYQLIYHNSNYQSYLTILPGILDYTCVSIYTSYLHQLYNLFYNKSISFVQYILIFLNPAIYSVYIFAIIFEWFQTTFQWTFLFLKIILFISLFYCSGITYSRISINNRFERINLVILRLLVTAIFIGLGIFISIIFDTIRIHNRYDNWSPTLVVCKYGVTEIFPLTIVILMITKLRMNPTIYLPLNHISHSILPTTDDVIAVNPSTRLLSSSYGTPAPATYQTTLQQ